MIRPAYTASEAANLLRISTMAGCSILICEDEPLIAIDIADAFSNVGVRVVTVRSLAQAFIVIEDDAPSAVILDHALSDGESSQLCDCLKEQNIRTCSTVGTAPENIMGRPTTPRTCQSLHRLNTS